MSLVKLLGVPVDRFDFHSQASQWIDKVVSETAGDLGKSLAYFLSRAC